MDTLVCRVFKWNYEQLLYGKTFLPKDIRFARASAPLTAFKMFSICIILELTGFLRDTTGSYDEGFYLGAAAMFASGLCQFIGTVWNHIKTNKVEKS